MEVLFTVSLVELALLLDLLVLVISESVYVISSEFDVSVSNSQDSSSYSSICGSKSLSESMMYKILRENEIMLPISRLTKGKGIPRWGRLVTSKTIFRT